MPEVTIEYKKKRTLNALREFAKYLDYRVVEEKDKQQKSGIFYVGNVPVVLSAQSKSAAKLKGAFTGKNISLTEIRKQVWR